MNADWKALAMDLMVALRRLRFAIDYNFKIASTRLQVEAALRAYYAALDNDKEALNAV